MLPDHFLQKNDIRAVAADSHADPFQGHAYVGGAEAFVNIERHHSQAQPCTWLGRRFFQSLQPRHSATAANPQDQS